MTGGGTSSLSRSPGRKAYVLGKLAENQTKLSKLNSPKAARGGVRLVVSVGLCFFFFFVVFYAVLHFFLGGVCVFHIA